MTEPTPSVADLIANATKAVEGDQATSDQTSTDATQPEPTPAEWQMVLDALPESLIPTVTPALEKYTEIQKSKYEDELKKFDPWKDITGQYQPDDVAKFIEFTQQFDADPVAVYQALEEHLVNLGLLEEAEEQAGGTPEATSQDEGVDEEILNHPAFKQLLQQQEQTAQALNQLLEAQQASQASAEEQENMAALDAYMKNLTDQYGELDEDYMLAKISQGVDGEVAAKQYRALVQGAQAQQDKPEDAPVVLGGGNSLPSNRIPNPAKMNRNQTNDLVVQILEAQRGQQ